MHYYITLKIHTHIVCLMAVKPLSPVYMILLNLICKFGILYYNFHSLKTFSCCNRLPHTTSILKIFSECIDLVAPTAFEDAIKMIWHVQISHILLHMLYNNYTCIANLIALLNPCIYISTSPQQCKH